MNFTMNNEPVNLDIDRLIFNPVDIYNSFDRFHFNSHHFFDDQENIKHKSYEDHITFISKIFDESNLFEIALNNNSDSFGGLDDYSFTKNDTTPE